MGSSQVPQKRDNLVSDLDTQLEIRIAFFFCSLFLLDKNTRESNKDKSMKRNCKKNSMHDPSSQLFPSRGLVLMTHQQEFFRLGGRDSDCQHHPFPLGKGNKRKFASRIPAFNRHPGESGIVGARSVARHTRNMRRPCWTWWISGVIPPERRNLIHLLLPRSLRTESGVWFILPRC